MRPETIRIKHNGAATTDNKINKTLKGVLINNHIKNSEHRQTYTFDDIEDSLLIREGTTEKPSVPEEKEQEESSFNVQKAMLPLLAGTGAIAGGIFILSAILKHSSSALLKSKSFEQLPDLAVNMNIKEEPHFALYRAIRNPDFKNILGAAAVCIMSGITIAAKNFTDGAKEIWVKKQSADIEKSLQENLIEVETNAFSGKLNVVNDMMNKNIKIFDKVLNKKEQPAIFAGFPSFKGSKEDSKKKKDLKIPALTVLMVLGALLLGKMSISNLRKTAQITNKYANKVTETTIDTINELGKKKDKADIKRITELFKSVCAKPQFIKDTLKGYNLSEEETAQIIKAVEESKKTIFSDAPTALGGIPEKIQYYCYLDENRGHLYNWILNPDNKFTKLIFMAFTAASAAGYLFKQAMDAIKEVAVLKENAKTELNLKKRLVDVEIANFKSKKESAVNPLVENFKKQAEEGKKTKEELKVLADNILTETKNGPPYVYT